MPSVFILNFFQSSSQLSYAKQAQDQLKNLAMYLKKLISNAKLVALHGTGLVTNNHVTKLRGCNLFQRIALILAVEYQDHCAAFVVEYAVKRSLKCLAN